MRTIFAALLILSYSVAFGQSLNTEVDNIYNFKPSKLSNAEQEAKVPDLDKFWNKVKSDTSSYLPALRAELKVSNHNPYFYFDGSALLLSLSKNALDKQLAANSIARSDLVDINSRQYVGTLNDLANDGINVTGAALKILSDTGFRFFVPQHSLTFDQSMCLTYMLTPENPRFYVDSLISRFKKSDPIAQKSILTTLWFTYSCKGDSLIKAVAIDQSLSKDVRNFTKGMMGHQALNKDENDYVKKASQSELADLRKKSLKRFSDEAIDELALTTKVLRNNSNCR
jgi:hypothetical protein